MQTDAAAEMRWRQLGERLTAGMGLYFPPERLPELQRGVIAAARDLALGDLDHCIEHLLTNEPSEAELQILASHLTVGETYFMREPQTLDALTEAALLPLIAARRGHRQQLRIWSAACSSGEEPYSVAILLQRLLPDWQDWDLIILATDINGQVLQRARTGIYGEWSFRQTPTEFRNSYFSRTPNGRYALMAPIRRCVSFRQLNLARGPLPFDSASGEPADLILCRNLLIYFEPAQTRRLIERFFGALGPGGWLAVSPSECSQDLFARFDAINLSGATLYRKPDGNGVASAGVADNAGAARKAGRHVNTVVPSAASSRTVTSPPPTIRVATDATSVRQRSRELANAGDLPAALACSERWIAADKLDPAAHYLQATILQEQGQSLGARRALERAIYLEPDFVLAHFALGNLARVEARERDASRHFSTTARLLGTRAADEILPHSEGMTVAQLAEIIAVLLQAGEAPARYAGAQR